MYRTVCRARNDSTVSRKHWHVAAGVVLCLCVVLQLFPTRCGCSSRSTSGAHLVFHEKKKTSSVYPQYRFGLEIPKQLRTSVRFALPKRSPKSKPSPSPRNWATRVPNRETYKNKTLILSKGCIFCWPFPPERWAGGRGNGWRYCSGGVGVAAGRRVWPCRPCASVQNGTFWNPSDTI